MLLPLSNCVTLGQLHSNKQTNKLRLRLPPPCYLQQDDLEFLILTVSPPQFWGFRCATTSGFLVVGMKPWASCMLGKYSTNGATALVLHRYFSGLLNVTVPEVWGRVESALLHRDDLHGGWGAVTVCWAQGHCFSHTYMHKHVHACTGAFTHIHIHTQECILISASKAFSLSLCRS